MSDFMDAARSFEVIVAFPVIWWLIRGREKRQLPSWVTACAYAFAVSAALRGMVLIASVVVGFLP